MANLFIGKDKGGNPVEISIDSMKRHFVCLGSSGSGKTVACKVLCEEFVRKGLPIIAIDCQGDIASLFYPEKPETLTKHGIDSSLLKEYKENAEVIIWTPASSKGIPLSMNPIDSSVTSSHPEERLRILDTTTKNIASLLGYDSEKDDGKEAESFLSLALEHIHKQNLSVKTFSELANFISALPAPLKKKTARIFGDREVVEIVKKLEIMTIGSRSMLYEKGIPLNIDTLLGTGRQNGKIRVSVIYLNSLHSQEEKEFFVSILVQKLYEWMLDHPSKDVQALFYFDEIAPFLPPTKKPACRDGLRLLFKQSRKYGISCLIASQNPGDLDYKSLSQFGSWNLGRLVTKQDINKVSDMIRSLAPVEAENICRKLPALSSGNFLLFSPDNFTEVKNYQVRWLLTKHSTIEEDQIPEMMADEIRKRFNLTDNIFAKELEKETSSVVRASDKDDLKVETKVINYLKSHKRCISRKELGEALDLNDKILKKVLANLEKNKAISSDKISSVLHFWHKDYRFNPSKGFVSAFQTAKLNFLEADAYRIAEEMLETWLFIKREEIKKADFLHLPVWKVSFEKEVEQGFIFKNIKVHQDSLYFDADNGKLILYVDGFGFKTADIVTTTDPLMIKDLDDACQWIELLPEEVEFNWKTKSNLISEKKVKMIVKRKFDVKVLDVSLVFLPLWRFSFKNKKSGKERKIIIDGVCGNVFQ